MRGEKYRSIPHGRAPKCPPRMAFPIAESSIQIVRSRKLLDRGNHDPCWRPEEGSSSQERADWVHSSLKGHKNDHRDRNLDSSANCPSRRTLCTTQLRSLFWRSDPAPPRQCRNSLHERYSRRG